MDEFYVGSRRGLVCPDGTRLGGRETSMKRSARRLAGLGFLLAAWAHGPSGLWATATDVSAECVECHAKVTRNVVNDWKLSEHAGLGIGCDSCHGSDHRTAEDAAKANLSTAETCGQCHADRLEQFKKGKHALAWSAVEAMPTIHYQPIAMTEGMKGCGGCHKIGLKSAEQVAELAKSGVRFGNASCDSCHTRHTFSTEEAKSPQACNCHTGFDHAQWEMYSSSKHGVREELKQMNSEASNSPIRRTCHMQEGNHGVRTAWGFLVVRLPMPEDKEWSADRVTVLQASSGQPTKLLEVVKAAEVARLEQASWQGERDKMVKTCNLCHSVNFAKEQLQHGDEMINADRLMAQAIREVAGSYKDGVLARPANYAYALPNLLTFHGAPTVVEQRLFVMFLEHRTRTFQGKFHASPDYALWYGWSEMQRDLTEIRELSAQMRKEHARGIEVVEWRAYGARNLVVLSSQP
jgi:hydroxylamine dehydrogenase